MANTTETVTVERFIPAPPEPIFALLADPSQHRVIDGSGLVRDAKTAGKLTLGSKFGMSMKAGMPYSMVSTVIEFEENRRIKWRTNGPTKLGQYFAGRTWGYVLTPTDGGTVVRETWDIGPESWTTKWMFRGTADTTRASMEATLARIEKTVTARPQ